MEAATALLHQNSLFRPKYSRDKPQTQSGQQERSIQPDISPSTFEKKLNPANEEPAVHRQLLQQGKARAGFSASGLWTKVPKFCANFTADICLGPALNLPLFVWRTAILPRCFTASPLNSVIPLRDLGVEGPAQKKLFFYKSKAKEDIKQQSQPEGTGRILRDVICLGKVNLRLKGPSPQRTRLPRCFVPRARSLGSNFSTWKLKIIKIFHRTAMRSSQHSSLP